MLLDRCVAALMMALTTAADEGAAGVLLASRPSRRDPESSGESGQEGDDGVGVQGWMTISGNCSLVITVAVSGAAADCRGLLHLFTVLKNGSQGDEVFNA